MAEERDVALGDWAGARDPLYVGWKVGVKTEAAPSRVDCVSRLCEECGWEGGASLSTLAEPEITDPETLPALLVTRGDTSWFYKKRERTHNHAGNHYKYASYRKYKN